MKALARFAFLFLLAIMIAPVSAETNDPKADDLQWVRPALVQGAASPDPAHPFRRLPAAYQSRVRPEVWELSKNAAGMFVVFRSDATNVRVRYTLENPDFQMSHMTQIGISGVDLFAIDENGEWNWVPGEHAFGTTVQATFKATAIARGNKPVEFVLFLPLYNTVEQLEIGIPKDASIRFPPRREERPIVAYGTSIMQGAVASRAGLAWTNILSRALDRTVINLGFSGNGRYELPLFELMAGTPARLFILDCMPNLVGIDAADLQSRLEAGLTLLQKQQPDVPILLAEHAIGHAPFYTDGEQREHYHEASLRMREVFEALRKKGFRNIHLLTEQEVGMEADSTIEGLHPNDIGMMRHARAYERKIREILGEPAGAQRIQQARRQSRDAFYDWGERHAAVQRELVEAPATHLLVGDSIIHLFAGKPAAGEAHGQTAWQQELAPLHVQNAGFGWDRIENVRWRLMHGEFDAFKGRDILLMIGTNNLEIDSDADIVQGIQSLALQFRERFPQQRVIVAGLLPRQGLEGRVAALNQALAGMAEQQGLAFRDLGPGLLSRGKVNAALFLDDGLHPSEAGYGVLGKAIAGVFGGVPAAQ